MVWMSMQLWELEFWRQNERRNFVWTVGNYFGFVIKWLALSKLRDWIQKDREATPEASWDSTALGFSRQIVGRWIQRGGEVRSIGWLQALWVLMQGQCVRLGASLLGLVPRKQVNKLLRNPEVTQLEFDNLYWRANPSRLTGIDGWCWNPNIVEFRGRGTDWSGD